MADIGLTVKDVGDAVDDATRPSWLALGVVCLAYCMFVALAQWADRQWGGWTLQRLAFEHGAWWQPLSSQWVHLNWRHAAANMVGFSVVASMLAGRLPGRVSAVLLAVSLCTVALLLVMDTSCAYYAGSSGAVYGWLAGGGLMMALGAGSVSDVRTRLLGFACVLWPVIRAAWQLWESHTGRAVSSLEILVYGPAHVAGILGGCIGGVLLILFNTSTRSRSPLGGQAKSQ